MHKLLVFIAILFSVWLGCASSSPKRSSRPALIGNDEEIKSLKLVDLEQKDWLLFETNDRTKILRISEHLRSAARMDTPTRIDSTVQIRIELGDGGSRIFQLDAKTGACRLLAKSQSSCYAISAIDEFMKLFEEGGTARNEPDATNKPD